MYATSTQQMEIESVQNDDMSEGCAYNSKEEIMLLDSLQGQSLNLESMHGTNFKPKNLIK